MILKSKIYLLVFVFSVALALQSCLDERFDIPDYTVTGDDVTLKLSVTLPEMDVRTRASLNDNSLNNVESLWIRTYSSDSGEATSDWKKLTPGTSAPEPAAQSVEFETKSGNSYIVAVANVFNNKGVLKSAPDEEKVLSELLDAADTWQDFLNIAVVSPSDFGSVNAPSAPLPMAGFYSDIIVDGSHPEPSKIDEWQTKGFKPFFIPSQKKTIEWNNKGAIHLRRLVSHVTFNIIPASDLDVSVNSYQVVNVPKYSWLYERPSANGMNANFGDLATSQEHVTDYYAEVPQFSSQYVTEGDGKLSFDFWMAENKHSGTSTVYTDRDKKVEGSIPPLFTSLTGEIWTPNNEASYVLISCDIAYNKQLSVDDKGQEVKDDGKDVYRTGSVTYLVHLGYIGGNSVNEATKSRDFNCFRNVDYTYNIKVNGINDIRIDAYATDETYHGEEGIVSDLEYSTIELDSHYHAFNVSLTKSEIDDPNFGFIITTYDNGTQITVNNDYEQKDGKIYAPDSATPIDQKYYNWIELRPTTDEETLAVYKPRYGANADGKTILLTDLKGGSANLLENQMSKEGWYTVFVNEYTYEPIYTGTEKYADETGKINGVPAWKSYVNQNPRRFYIRTARKESPDGNSVYTRSKYGVSQSSIQTYYSIIASRITDKGTAIGTERINETEGLNLRTAAGDTTFIGGTSENNGRLNVAQWLNYKTAGSDINNENASSRPKWADVVDAAKPMEIGAVDLDRAQGGRTLPERTIALPSLRTYGGAGTFSDPQKSGSYIIHAINACMSRNRDNNGNGRIEPDELRWYVPAMGKYLRLLMGAPSLSEPVMDFGSVDRLPKVEEKEINGNKTYSWIDGEDEYGNDPISNNYISRYMFYASNGSVLWAMEGMSSSSWNDLQGWSNNQSHPWQIRCIRNLGTDLTSVSDGEKVDMAYIVDKNNRTVEAKYYDDASVRPNKLSGNGTGGSSMPVHLVTSDYNRVYRKFEYHSADIEVPSYNKSLTGLQGYINGNPCQTANGHPSGTGWRVPNQTEIAILKNATEILNGTHSSWLSCTVNYFNSITGYGGEYANGENLFLGMLSSRGTQFTSGNIKDFTMYIRCVRDID